MNDLFENDEFLEYEANEENEQEPLARYQINSYSVDKAIESLIKWKENGKLEVPEFQRDFVWNYNNSCRFIDSILLNLPIPNIFVFKIKRDNIEKYLLVDGMQRMTTIEQFKKGKWTQGGESKNFKINMKKSSWHGMTFDDLPEDDKEFFLDYSISMTIFETSSREQIEINKAIFSVFERINTGSEKLSEQEIRKAVYGGDCLACIKKLTDLDCFKVLTSNDKTLLKREKNVEFILRLLTYLYIYRKIKDNKIEMIDGIEETKITTSKCNMLNIYVDLCNNGKINYKEDIELVIKAFESLSSYSSCLYSIKRDGSGLSNRVHEVFAEALILAVINNNHEINIDENNFSKIKLALWNSKDVFYENFIEKTTAKENIKNRVYLMLGVINGNQIWNA